MNIEDENIGRRIGDIGDLPEELLEQLQITKKIGFENEVCEIIGGFKGGASVDEIMVAYYRKNKKVLKRTYLTNRLYKMIKTDLIEAVERKKGVFKLKENKKAVISDDPF